MSSTDDRHGDEQTDTRLAAEYAKNHPKPATAALASVHPADLRPVPAAGEAATEDVIERARKVIADKVWEIHGPDSTDMDSAEMDAEDIVAALAAANLLASPDAIRQAKAEADDLAEALRRTVDYVGLRTLPAIEGWSWFDALRKHRPDLVAELTAAPRPASHDLPTSPADRIGGECGHPNHGSGDHDCAPFRDRIGGE